MARNAIAQAPVLPSVFHNLIGLECHRSCWVAWHVRNFHDYRMLKLLHLYWQRYWRQDCFTCRGLRSMLDYSVGRRDRSTRNGDLRSEDETAKVGARSNEGTCITAILLKARE